MADVKKVLVSAAQVCAAGNICVLDTENVSYIQNKTSGSRTAVDYRDGEFKFDIWIPAGSPARPINGTNVFDGLPLPDEIPNEGFQGQEWTAP